VLERCAIGANFKACRCLGAGCHGVAPERALLSLEIDQTSIMAASHLPHQIFLLRTAAFFWFAATVLMGSDSEGVRLWALLMALYPLLIWILYVVSDQRAEYFQSFFVIDSAVLAVPVCRAASGFGGGVPSALFFRRIQDVGF